MTQLRKAEEKDRQLLFNVFQKFLHEMTAYYDNPLNAEGNYEYGWLDSYFEDPDREAVLIYEEDRLAGFALLNKISYLNRTPDHVLAEFTVFPHFRRKHTGLRAVRQLFALYPGQWELKYSRKNTGAAKFWSVVSEPYHPVRHRYSEDETVITFRTEAQRAG